MLFSCLITKSLKNNPLGFHSLNKGLALYSWESDTDRINFQQLFSGSKGRKEKELESLKEQYKSYKESYVKYMQFDPEEANLS